MILAAGYSSRMGDFKPLMTLGEKAALEHLVETFQAGGLSQDAIFVVSGYQRQLLEPLIRNLGIGEIFNPDFQEGMFSSIQVGMKGIQPYLEKEDWPGIFLTQVDCPLPNPLTIQALLREAKEDRKKPPSILVPAYRGKKGHPVFIPREYVQKILGYQGKMGLKSFFFEQQENLRILETGDEGAVLDMDTRQDYRELQDYLTWKQTDGTQGEERLSLRGCLDEGRRLILVRHFRQIQVGEPIFLGQTDLPLSQEGIEAGLECLEKLRQLKPRTKVIHASDLARARQTAEILQARWPGGPEVEVEIRPHSFLREINLGEWDGRPVREIREKDPEAYQKRGQDLAGFKASPASENFYDLRYRVLRGLIPLIRQAEDPDILVVTHDGVIKVLLAEMEGKDGEVPGNRAIGYGEIIVLEGKGRGQK